VTARRNAAVHDRLQQQAQQLVEKKKKSKVLFVSLCLFSPSCDSVRHTTASLPPTHKAQDRLRARRRRSKTETSTTGVRSEWL
jgi:hypothetical protein